MNADRFVNRKQALNWLRAQGYKVSQGKFYTDCKEGFPEVGGDGSVSKFQVLEYGQQLDVATRSALPGELSRENELRKAAAEADIAEMKAERMRREEDVDWLHASTAWAAVAAVVGSLRDALRHHFHLAQGELVQAAGGDLERRHELYEACETAINDAFNEVAGDDLTVDFDGGKR